MEKGCPSIAIKSFLTVPQNSVIPKKFFCLIQTVNFEDSFIEEIQLAMITGYDEEDCWLSLSSGEMDNAENSDDAISWTAFHESMHRDNTDNGKTIIAILPVIDHVSHSNKLQLH